MKHTIDIPDGHEVLSESIILSQRDETDGYGQDMIVVHLKKKQQKTFDWYVDQYLDVSAGSTNYEIRNWLDNDDLKTMSERLKTKQYNLVPWEVKIGLFKFICWDIEIDFSRVLFLSAQSDNMFEDEMTKVMPRSFINELLKTK